MKKSNVVKVGVTFTRFVSLNNARPWVIHAYRNLKGRGLHVDEDSENAKPIDKIDDIHTRTPIQDREPYLYTESAAGTVTTGEDKITINQDKAEEPAKKSTDELSPKKRKLDTGGDSASDKEVKKVGSEIAAETKGKICEKRKLSLESKVVTSTGAKKRKIVESSGVSDLDTAKESAGSVKDKTELDGKRKEGNNTQVGIDTDLTNVRDTSIDNVTSNTSGREDSGESSVTNVKEKTEREVGSKEIDTNVEGSEGAQTKRVRKRKLPKESEEEKTEAPAVSTYDKVRLIIQPWRKPEGGINKPILKMMLESVMLFLMMNPGSPEEDLAKRYEPYLQPMILRNIVDVLEDIGCVTRQYISKTKPTLFSKPSLPSIGSDETENSTVLMVPAEDCVLKMGLFGQEVFPNAKWPENTYSHKRPYP